MVKWNDLLGKIMPRSIQVKLYKWLVVKSVEITVTWQGWSWVDRDQRGTWSAEMRTLKSWVWYTKSIKLIYEKRTVIHTRLLLQLRGDIAQGVLSTATIFWYIVRPHLSSSHYWLVHQRSLAITNRNIWQRSRWNLREMAVNFAKKVSLSYSAGFFSM
jgi:hypothetical protein